MNDNLTPFKHFWTNSISSLTPSEFNSEFEGFEVFKDVRLNVLESFVTWVNYSDRNDVTTNQQWFYRTYVTEKSARWQLSRHCRLENLRCHQRRHNLHHHHDSILWLIAVVRSLNEENNSHIRLSNMSVHFTLLKLSMMDNSMEGVCGISNPKAHCHENNIYANCNETDWNERKCIYLSQISYDKHVLLVGSFLQLY